MSVEERKKKRKRERRKEDRGTNPQEKLGEHPAHQQRRNNEVLCADSDEPRMSCMNNTTQQYHIINTQH